MTDVLSIDPRTGEPVEVVAPETTTAEVNRLCTAALAAALASMRSAARAGRRYFGRSPTAWSGGGTTSFPSPTGRPRWAPPG